MAREFKETAHLNTDTEKYASNYDRIFGKRTKCYSCESTRNCKIVNDQWTCTDCKKTVETEDGTTKD